jgi:hypothetical protein
MDPVVINVVAWGLGVGTGYAIALWRTPKALDALSHLGEPDDPPER